MRRAIWMVIGLLPVFALSCLLCIGLAEHGSMHLIGARARIFRDMLQFGRNGLSLLGRTDWMHYPLGVEVVPTEWIPELDGLAALLLDYLPAHHIASLYIILTTAFATMTAWWIGYRFLHRQMAHRLAFVAGMLTFSGDVLGLLCTNTILPLHWLILGLITDLILVKRIMSKINVPSRLVCDRLIICALSFGAGWGAVSWVGLIFPLSLGLFGLFSGHSRRTLAPWSAWKRMYWLPAILCAISLSIFLMAYLPTEMIASRELIRMERLALTDFAHMVLIAVTILSVVFAAEIGSFWSIKILSAIVLFACLGMLIWESGPASLKQRLRAVALHIQSNYSAGSDVAKLSPETIGDAAILWPSCLPNRNGNCTFPDVQSLAAELVSRGFKVSSLLALAWRADEQTLNRQAAQGMNEVDREQVRGCPIDESKAHWRNFVDYTGFRVAVFSDSHVAKDCKLRSILDSANEEYIANPPHSYSFVSLVKSDLSKSPEDPYFSLDARGMVNALVDIIAAESIARVVAPFSWRKMLQIAQRDARAPFPLSIEYVEGASEIFTALREMDGCLDCAAIITVAETSHIPNGWRVVTRTDQIVLLRPSSPINQGEPRLDMGEKFGASIDIRGDEVRWSGTTLEVKLTNAASEVTFPLVRLPENARLKLGIAVADFGHDVEFEVWFADAVVYRKVLSQRIALEDFEVDLRPYAGIQSNIRFKARRLRGEGDVMISWLQPQLMGLAGNSP